MLIGLMSTKDTQEHQYFTELAKAAKSLDMNVCKFVPEHVDITTKKIKGERFDKEKEVWRAATFDLPDFVYDRCFHGMSRENNEMRENINWLKENVTFIGRGLPGKWDVYQTLKTHPLLQAFFPETMRVTSSDEIIEQLERLETIIIKPEFGSGGLGIYQLAKTKDGATTVSTTKKGVKYDREFESKSQLNKWLQHLLTRYSYLCQPYLELSTEKNEPFDLRILLQKNERNQWLERGRGVRLGKPGHITSNLTTGGEALALEAFIKKSPDAIPVIIEQTIQHILRTLPVETEASFHRLFELGVDLGIDRKGQIWILDINSKPGRKIVQSLHPDSMKELYMAPFKYSKYLADHLLKAGE